MLQSLYIILQLLLLIAAQCESVAGFALHQPSACCLKGTSSRSSTVVLHIHPHTLWAKNNDDTDTDTDIDSDIDSDSNSFDTTSSFSSKSKPSLSSSSSSWSSSMFFKPILDDPKRSFLFSLVMIVCGALLGPFLDSYHSAFSVLEYEESTRITFILWGSQRFPALTTSWWVPELFAVAGFLIGWLYILFDNNNKNSHPVLRLNNIQNKEEERQIIPTSPTNTKSNTNNNNNNNPSPVKVLLGISLFTFQYYLSGLLYYEYHCDRTTLLNIMSVITAMGFVVLDGTRTGFMVSTMTAVGGPLIEVVLLSGIGQEIGIRYQYTDVGETGYFPLWIVPVYFLGGPANGNLARLFWHVFTTADTETESETTTTQPRRISSSSSSSSSPCEICNNTRRDECPNCDGVGTYNAMGNTIIPCTCCNGRGYVMCRTCFHHYDEDPYDIETIRTTMNRMPD